MTSAERSSSSIGWVTSLCLHAALAYGALVATQQITLPPSPAPFTWDVALVAGRSVSLPPTVPPADIQTPVDKPHPGQPVPSASTTIPGHVSENAVTTTEPSVPVFPEGVTTQIDQVSADEGMISPPPVASTTPLASGQAEASSETAVVSQPHEGGQTAILPTQTLGLDSVVASPPRPDYAWLAETILRRMEGLKKYPAEARLDSAEGKVILKAVIRSDGHVENVEIFQSSGHQSLDHAAVELLNLAAPFQFPRQMDRPQMTLKIPMRYRLE